MVVSRGVQWTRQRKRFGKWMSWDDFVGCMAGWSRPPWEREMADDQVQEGFAAGGGLTEGGGRGDQVVAFRLGAESR